MAKTIMIIEDEAPLRDMLRFILNQAGFGVLEAEDSKQAFMLLTAHNPDLILLDWMLPGMSGIEIAKHLKQQANTADIPLIILTARAAEDNKIKGFETGADDYIVKPFAPRELLARINAVLRRTSPNSEYLEINGLRLELATQRVTVGGKEIKLSPKEYQLLHFFMEHPDKIYTRAQLLDKFWSNQLDIDERTVDVCIRRLRKALGLCRDLIVTVHGTGYRFVSNKPL